MPILKTPDNRIILQDYIKEAMQSHHFRNVARKTVKVSKEIISTLGDELDGSKIDYPKVLRMYGDSLPVSHQPKLKKSIHYSAVTCEGQQLFFCQMIYPLPHVSGISISYRTVILQSTKGVVVDRFCAWAIHKDYDVIINQKDKVDKEMRELVSRYPNDDILIPLANIALTFTSKSVARRDPAANSVSGFGLPSFLFI